MRTFRHGHVHAAQDFGGTSATSRGDNDLFFGRYDSQGQLKWVKTAGGVGYEEATAVTLHQNGQLVVSGRFRSPELQLESLRLTTSTGEGFFIAWYSADGVMQRVRANIGGYSLATDSAGNLLIAGHDGEPALLKLDNNGDKLWETTVPGTFLPQTVVSDGTGNIYLSALYYGTISLSGRSFTSLGD